jgi:predicted hydrocarbon binding protein
MQMDKSILPVFDWASLGDVALGRQDIGTDVPVVVYRLFQYCMKAVLKQEYGENRANDLVREAGYLAGIHFAQNALADFLSGDLDFFVTSLHDKLAELKIGYLNIERVDLETMTFTLTVDQDLDCSGLPVTDETVCDYDEGFISGILEVYTGQPFCVKEVDCWSNGARTCRFEAKSEAKSTK